MWCVHLMHLWQFHEVYRFPSTNSNSLHQQNSNSCADILINNLQEQKNIFKMNKKVGMLLLKKRANICKWSREK